MAGPHGRRLALLLVSTACAAAGAHADPVPRAPLISGQVIQTRSAEEIDIVELQASRLIEVRQDVKAGDVIRTNAAGQVALLFADRTQVRVARNSVLVVKEVRTDGGVSLALEDGEIYARAARGGSGVSVATPSATAAIRGTDWTMSVCGDRTTLSVLEGLVDLSNPQGTVSVATGESAVATLGAAPAKIVIAGGDQREQMLFNLSLRDVFTDVPVAVSTAELREAQSLEAVPPARRDAEARVRLAEAAQARGGAVAAARAVAEARGLRLTREQEARLLFVEAGIAGTERRYEDAARLYERAAAGTTGDRRVQARYFAYYARSLADPSRAAARPPADSTSLASVLGEAQIASIQETPRRSLEILQAGEGRFGGSAAYQARIANAAVLASDFDAAAAAIAKGEAIDATDAALLAARGAFRRDVKGDLRGSLRDLREAARLEPGDYEVWNEIAVTESARGATREAEDAYKRALALNPQNPAPLANYAALLLNTGRNREAAELIDRALALDPAYAIAFHQRGRQKLQEGDEEGGLEDMLRATAANPTYSDGLLSLGATYAARNEVEPARQSFELAERLDPLAPEPAQFLALLSVFEYEADEAVAQARASLERTRARGGDYASIESSGDFGSVLGGVYRFVSLDAWGRYYGDRTFDPFQGASYFDQALTGTVGRFYSTPGGIPSGEPTAGDDAAFSLYTQGLLLDPLAVVTPRRRPSFFRSPFQEAEVGAGVSRTDGEIGGTGTASYQRLGYDPLPYSFSVSTIYSGADTSFATQDIRNFNSTVQAGAQVTPNDTVVAYLNGVHAEGGASFDGVEFAGFDLTRDDRLDASGLNGFVGWSHSFGYHNLLSAAVSGFVIDREGEDAAFDLFPDFGGVQRDVETDEDQYTLKGGLSYLLGVTDDLTLRLGAETGHVESSTEGTIEDIFLAFPGFFNRFPGRQLEVEGETSRFWAGASWDPTPAIRLEGTLFGESVGQTTTVEAPDGRGGLLPPVETSDEIDQWSPRIGLAIAPMEGQFLRAAFLRETPLSELNTLAPVGTVGLRSDLVPEGSGSKDTTILRWDSEWTDRFFTATEYQHQEIDNFSLSLPLSVPIFSDAASVGIPNAEIDRLSVTANLWIGGGFSAFGSYTRLRSSGDAPGTEDGLPTVPEHLARVGLSFISPQRFRVAVAETYVGRRNTFGDPNVDADVFIEADDAFVTDISASWESEDRHLAFDVSASNIFGVDAVAAPLLPALPRTLTATLRARF